ncbi:uncharacterized protein B0I36DRAFT_368099 [Microdochium trichocladiopsis]|uniref:Saccharopine dehydrogenase NADP binding domain-containing protein n=1 Tax=Microdochium trichocladiopsis TaxID=1682393 RepID=A0A9P9BJD9_9PEZI|nr:uncharacterized protein B0I36DRAFT_368099 [Microdochium trichocladiopsis]KAH7018048.1 hypothetical protein B0I36DRAFT_368099 [Microdochium trichocladiopsis]
MPTVFFIGATGHIGGAILHLLTSKDKFTKDLQIRALVRDSDKATRLQDKFPKVKNLECVVGDLKTLDVLEREAEAADIVINTAPDITHDDGINAVLDGLSAGPSKAYYIHTAGASLIWDEPTGNPEAREWDDIADLEDIKKLDVAHTHSQTDRQVRAAHAPGKLHVAIVSPVMVGGMSPFSSEHPIAEGKNQFGWVHVDDLARIYEGLVADALGSLAAAAAGDPSDVTSADATLWGPDAYYFGSAKNYIFHEWMQGIVPALQMTQLIKTSDIKSVNVHEAARKALYGGTSQEYDENAPPPPEDSWAMHIAIMYAINMRVRPSRAAKLLDWKPEKDVMADWEHIFQTFLKREAAEAAAVAAAAKA